MKKNKDPRRWRFGSMNLNSLGIGSSESFLLTAKTTVKECSTHRSFPISGIIGKGN